MWEIQNYWISHTSPACQWNPGAPQLQGDKSLHRQKFLKKIVFPIYLTFKVLIIFSYSVGASQSWQVENECVNME